MAITVNLRYTGMNGSARRFAEEMERTGTADAIRAEAGNIRYEYYLPMNDPETVLLIDAWESQEALDIHHASPMMAAIAALREKYDLHMTVERFVSIDDNAADGVLKLSGVMRTLYFASSSVPSKNLTLVLP